MEHNTTGPPDIAIGRVRADVRALERVADRYAERIAQRRAAGEPTTLEQQEYQGLIDGIAALRYYRAAIEPHSSPVEALRTLVEELQDERLPRTAQAALVRAGHVLTKL